MTPHDKAKSIDRHRAYHFEAGMFWFGIVSSSSAMGLWLYLLAAIQEDHDMNGPSILVSSVVIGGGGWMLSLFLGVIVGITVGIVWKKRRLGWRRPILSYWSFFSPFGLLVLPLIGFLWFLYR